MLVFSKLGFKILCMGLPALVVFGFVLPAWAGCDGSDIMNASIFARQTRDWDLFTDLHNNQPLKLESAATDPNGSNIQGLADSGGAFVNGFLAADQRKVLTPAFSGTVIGIPTSVEANITSSIQSRQKNNPPLDPQPEPYPYERGSVKGYKGTTGANSLGFNSQTAAEINCQQNPIKNPQRPL